MILNCDYFSPVSLDDIDGSAPGGGGRSDAEDLWKKLTGKS